MARQAGTDAALFRQRLRASRGIVLCLFRPTAESVMDDEATYICDACGEEIVIPIDYSAGPRQTYVEDCPVCCRPNVVHLEIDEMGETRSWAEPEAH